MMCSLFCVDNAYVEHYVLKSTIPITPSQTPELLNRCVCSHVGRILVKLTYIPPFPITVGFQT